MSKLKLSPAVSALNPGLPADARLPARRCANADKAAAFLDAWRTVTAIEREYRVIPAQPVAEYPFAMPRHHYRADFCFVAQRVLVEVDGGQYAPHGGRHATDRDRDKLNYGAACGWRILRFSPQQLEDDPTGCVLTVLEALDWRPR